MAGAIVESRFEPLVGVIGAHEVETVFAIDINDVPRTAVFVYPGVERFGAEGAIAVSKENAEANAELTTDLVFKNDDIQFFVPVHVSHLHVGTGTAEPGDRRSSGECSSDESLVHYNALADVLRQEDVLDAVASQVCVMQVVTGRAAICHRWQRRLPTFTEGAIAVTQADADVTDTARIELIGTTCTDRHDQIRCSIVIDICGLHRIEITFTILVRAGTESKVHRQRCHERSLEARRSRLANANRLADSI